MTPEAARTIGVFGGTFDPLHLGHLIAAQDALEALSLDRVLLVPARRSPLKVEEPVASAALRVQMIRAATEGDARFELSELEVARQGPSYTVETLRILRTERPKDRLVLIMGADQWAQFAKWRDAREIASIAEIGLVTRSGDRPSTRDAGLSDGPPLRFREVSVTRIDVSASLVRRRARAGRSIRYLVPEPVRRIIEANNLYLNEPEDDPTARSGTQG